MQPPTFEKDYIQQALEASGTGTWYFDTATGEMHADALAKQLFGVTHTGTLHYTTVFNHAHPDDTTVVHMSLEVALLSAAGQLKIRYRPLAGDSPPRWIQVSGRRVTSSSFSGTVQDVTAETSYNLDLMDSEMRYRAMIQEASVAVGLYLGKDLTIGQANDIMLGYWGKDRSVIGMRLQDAVPELEGQSFIQILLDVFNTGKTYEVTEEPAELAVNGVPGIYYFDFAYKPLYDAAGNIYAIMNMAIDVTDRVLSKRKLIASEAKFRAITIQSPIAIGVLKGRDMIIEVGNDRIFEVWGKDASVTGKPIVEALPEIKDQPFIGILEQVYDTGQPYYGYDVLAKLEFNGVIKEVYFDFTYTPLRDENNEISGILIVANDVTQKVVSLKKIVESEAKFRALMKSAPAAMVLFIGKEEMIIDNPNQALLDFIGRDESIIGKPLLEAVPEIEGQESLRLIRHCFETGEKMHSYGRQVKLIKNGVLTQNYYNVSYTPIYDADGNIYAVLDTAIDVTESITARQAIEKAEAALRGAIELADLGTWNLDPKTGMVTCSERIQEWFGLDGENEDFKRMYDSIHPKDRARIEKAIYNALAPGSTGVYDEEYTVINIKTGYERILHAQGKTFFNSDGEPYSLIGTAQDITSHRELQIALSQQVQERTEALLAANQQLEDANRRLVASNEELAQYAYVASHDLQEPLRKIRMFSNLLDEKDTDNKHKGVIDKILKSSERMSLLIKDLLEFSRLLNTENRFVPVSLDTVVHNVIDDFELLIAERRRS